jgi:hypothetical protein
MTTQLDTPPFMPAQNPTHPDPTGPRGEGVKAVALFESRQGRVPRAWDEMTELDRIVLLEMVRQRRKMQQQKQKLESEIYRLRSTR